MRSEGRDARDGGRTRSADRIETYGKKHGKPQVRPGEFFYVDDRKDERRDYTREPYIFMAFFTIGFIAAFAFNLWLSLSLVPL